MRKQTLPLIPFSIFILTGLLFILTAPQPAQAQSGTAADLIAPINAYRSANALAVAITDTPNSQPGLASAVITSTTNPNGSVVHIIQYGETLIQIAEAYGITLSQLLAANPDLDPQNPVYYAGDALVIAPPFTATPVLSPTLTPLPPTHTPRPTYTTTLTRTPTKITTPTPTLPSPTPTKAGLEVSDKTLGLGIILVSAIGLVAVIIWGFLKK